MKPLRIVALTLAAMALPALLQAQSFEGKIQQREIVVSMSGLNALLYSDEEAEEAEVADVIFDIPLAEILALADEHGEEAVQVTDLTFYVGTDRMRVEAEVELMPGYMIMDFESAALRMVMPTQRMYLEITAEDMQTLQEQFGDELEAEEKDEAEVRALGLTREINGMTCEAYEIRMGDALSRTWVSNELRDLVTAFAGFMTRMEAFSMEEDEGLEVFVLMQEHGFPVLEQTLYDYGWEQQYEISEIVSVERGPVAAEKFTIPADFERRSFMEMMQMFGGEGGD
ncbi:MAG: DUF4412 domain-containing protein [Gemmatimonadetes bacterium]|uniref:DUF4412 domain-containing protein n=1 Tax=Candidatus Kutchimonas denitrificans TaxID=3056748 RepID=A0AAE4ZCA1_9BACT|nr:DUF4412 domain-containing protein [Gemmatimonadota bacterium]NIR75806.1 DUF4412 domain-containing protein [Candidatus Kutchimonas denitrificans]NIS01974.1 DUF4412 domain-containing protein [Gemmatimonadota bacterium]NIT67778.1 DUF4412 domain-containing protein [Gemmatimonadota bacterium]NIU53765.1 DUF4412 domain-containing protein [Gemmatimonadota bacterium]